MLDTIDPPLSQEIFLLTPLCHKKIFNNVPQKCKITHIINKLKKTSKSAFLGSFCNFSVPFRLLEHKVLLPLCWKNPNPPPHACPFYIHSCRSPPCPSMRRGGTRRKHRNNKAKASYRAERNGRERRKK